LKLPVCIYPSVLKLSVGSVEQYVTNKTPSFSYGQNKERKILSKIYNTGIRIDKD
jgi:hypothetical protein